MRQVYTEALQALFENYIQSGGTGICYLGEIAHRHNMQPHELGSLLKNNGTIKHPQFLPTDFGATISRNGIEIINPEFLNNKREKIITTLGINGNDWSSILETLDMQPEQFQIAHDIAHWLSDDNIIEWQPQASDIYIKLTYLGKELFENGRARFFE